ncbi:MAG: hypothetical protein LQ343_000943 [Gyalolechia ehrenbergii]|nr:MAG: hypothetical protein LQ343_000943 [Gyalolechia ehrenbergii]
MASLILVGGVLVYEKVQASRAKRTAHKAHNAARFSELEAENAARMRNLQGNKGCCLCYSGLPDWDKRVDGCPVHGAGAKKEGVVDAKVGGREGEREKRRSSEGREGGRRGLVLHGVEGRLRGFEGSESEREGNGPRRIDTFAMTGETENEVLDGCVRDGDGDEDANSEGPLVVPDVRGVMPVYREGKGGKEKDKGFGKRTLKEKVLRKKKRDSGGGMEGKVVR